MESIGSTGSVLAVAMAITRPYPPTHLFNVHTIGWLMVFGAPVRIPALICVAVAHKGHSNWVEVALVY